MKEFLYKFATFTSFIAIIFLEIIHITINEFSINGIFLLLLLMMFLNPVLNFIKINKKIILNPIYNILLIINNIYISYISYNSIKLSIKSYSMIITNNRHNIEYINSAKEYINNYLVYIIIIVLIILLISFFLKRTERKEMINNKILLYILSSVIFTQIFFIFFSYNLHVVVELSNMLTLLWLILNKKLEDNITETEYYLILFILNIFSINPVRLVITYYIYIQYKKGLLGYNYDLD